MQMMKMTEEIIMLMAQLVEFHNDYKKDYESFKSRMNLELTYWHHFKKLQKMINHQFETIKPFSNQ